MPKRDTKIYQRCSRCAKFTGFVCNFDVDILQSPHFGIACKKCRNELRVEKERQQESDQIYFEHNHELNEELNVNHELNANFTNNELHYTQVNDKSVSSPVEQDIQIFTDSNFCMDNCDFHISVYPSRIRSIRKFYYKTR